MYGAHTKRPGAYFESSVFITFDAMRGFSVPKPLIILVSTATNRGEFIFYPGQALTSSSVCLEYVIVREVGKLVKMSSSYIPLVTWTFIIFQLFYQPRTDCDTAAISCWEAEVRYSSK